MNSVIQTYGYLKDNENTQTLITQKSIFNFNIIYIILSIKNRIIWIFNTITIFLNNYINMRYY